MFCVYVYVVCCGIVHIVNDDSLQDDITAVDGYRHHYC